MQTVYTALRQEIVKASDLMHWLTVVTLLALLVGLVVCENRRTVLSVLLPLLSLAWAASVVRLDFFIQRIGIYLLPIEDRLLESSGIQSWEKWKGNLLSTKILVPITDTLLFATIFVVTVFILFGPAQSYFKERQWCGANSYSISILILIIALLTSMAFMPNIVRH